MKQELVCTEIVPIVIEPNKQYISKIKVNRDKVIDDKIFNLVGVVNVTLMDNENWNIELDKLQWSYNCMHFEPNWKFGQPTEEVIEFNSIEDSALKTEVSRFYEDSKFITLTLELSDLE